MPTIRVVDGTCDPKFGKALLPALGQFANYSTVSLVGAVPGSWDIPGYNLVKRWEAAHYNPDLQKVHSRNLAMSVLNDPAYQYRHGVDTIILSECDFYRDCVAWSFGFASRDNQNNGIVAVSTYRLATPEAVAHVVTHELGHLYDAAPEGRRNTTNHLGSHCTNLCIMQQKDTVAAMHAHVSLLATRREKFCTDCQDDLTRYFRNHE